MRTGRDPQVRQAFELARGGNNDRAREILVQLLDQDRDNFDAWMALAQITENHQEAIASMLQALRLHPNDEKANRYLDHLRQDEQTSREPTWLSPWPWSGLVAALFVFLAIAAVLLTSRPGTPEQSDQQANQPVIASGAQPVSVRTVDCATLIHKALEISDQGCQTVGRNQVCYGHNTVEAQLVPGANARFDRPGSTIPIDILESFIAFPYDPQKGDWGVGVFRLEANLPGTLPGQLVTMLVFGNTTLQNVSGNMQAFYFSSGLGGIKCDAVPFDGILVRMAEGAGFSFQVNGAAVTLQGNSILQATANDDLAVTTLSGTGKVSSLGEEQSLDTGQTVTVPLGGEDGMNAEDPPTSPQPADATMLESTNCTLASEGCSEQPSPSPLAEAEDKTSLETDKEATTAGSLDDAKDDEELSKDKTTPTPPSLKKTERVKVTLVPVSTVASKPTEILKPTNTPEPITDTKPTEIPEPTEPIDIPKPTNVPKPTDEVKPVDEVEPTKEG